MNDKKWFLVKSRFFTILVTNVYSYIFCSFIQYQQEYFKKFLKFIGLKINF